VARRRQASETLGVLGVYLGIILVFLSYELFNKMNPSFPPLIMRGWLDVKIPILPIFVISYLSFHVLAEFFVLGYWFT
jgi:hypothetical protein